MEKEIWNVVKGMFEILKSQQALIHNLSNSHYRLIAALQGAGSTPTDGMPAEALTDTEAIAKADAGIAELERIFKLEKDGDHAS
jgi:hypothetical protein